MDGLAVGGPVRDRLQLAKLANRPHERANFGVKSTVWYVGIFYIKSIFKII